MSMNLNTATRMYHLRLFLLRLREGWLADDQKEEKGGENGKT